MVHNELATSMRQKPNFPRGRVGGMSVLANVVGVVSLIRVKGRVRSVSSVTCLPWRVSYPFVSPADRSNQTCHFVRLGCRLAVVTSLVSSFFYLLRGHA